jgi:hypothetical protein
MAWDDGSELGIPLHGQSGHLGIRHQRPPRYDHLPVMSRASQRTLLSGPHVFRSVFVSDIRLHRRHSEPSPVTVLVSSSFPLYCLPCRRASTVPGSPCLRKRSAAYVSRRSKYGISRSSLSLANKSKRLSSVG